MPIVSPFVLWMWVLWGVLVLAFLALKIYTGRLTRDEDDQLVLDDSFDRVRQQQVTIAAQLNRVEPLKRTVLVLLAAVTIFIIGYYVLDMIHQLQ